MRIRSSRLIRAVAFLLGCLALGSRLLCCSTDVPCVLRVPVIAFLSPRIALGSRLLFALRQTGRLAECCVPVPQWVEIAGRAFSGCRAVIGLGWFTSGLCVSLWRSRRGAGDAGNGVTRGMGLTARREYVFAQPHWLCSAFRREYAGAARPRLRQRVFDSLDSLHLIRGVGAHCAAKPSRVQRRLDRLQ